MLLGRTCRRPAVAVAALLTIAFLYLVAQSDPSTRKSWAEKLPGHHAGQTESLRCRDLPGASETVVILKTGSTELQDKLPVHLNTTLRCYPNYLIFSDYGEQYKGETILDAIEDVDPLFKQTHEDLGFYRQLQKSGREALDPAELSGPTSEQEEGTSGKLTSPGWALDKWKFLPMIHKTLQEYPDKTWYVFLETDTYIFWNTMLAYLAALDSTKPYYIGSQGEIGDVLFAHGGSGFVVSRPALEKAVKLYVKAKGEYEAFVSGHWAGDCVLGKVLRDSGTPLTWAWPIWQGDDIGNMNYSSVIFDKRLWCYASVSYHHLSPPAIEELWRFEQEWIARHQEGSIPVLRHPDVYREYVLARTETSRSDWHNHADVDRGPSASLEECRSVCDNDSSCLQFALNQDWRCLTSSHPSLGEASPGMQSGWIQERMQAFPDKMAACADGGWIT